MTNATLFEFYPDAGEDHCVSFWAMCDGIGKAKALLDRMIPHVSAGGRQITAASAFFEANADLVNMGSTLYGEPDSVIQVYDLEGIGPQVSHIENDTTGFLGPLEAFLNPSKDYQDAIPFGATEEPHPSAFVG